MALLLTVLALGVAGCGGDDDGDSGGATGTIQAQAASACPGQQLASPTDVTLILDFLPNPVHIAIYQGLATGTYKANNINLKVQAPTSTSDTLRLLATDRADIGIVSLLDFLTSYSQRQPVTAFMALKQRPLGSLLALEKSGVASPKDLEGQTVGVTGVPSDLAAVNSMVANAGGDPTKVKTVTIGFNAVQNLVAGKVKAAVGFWNAEGVQLQAQEPTTVFKLDEFGAPAYPELVAFTRNDTISSNPALVCAFTKATVDGYTTATANPDQALGNLTKQAEGLALSDAKAQYEALKPVGVLLKGAELLLSGATCVNDMFCHTNLGSEASLGAVDGLEELGLRGVVAFGPEDMAGPDRHPIGDVLAEHEALASRCASAGLVGFRRGVGTVLGQTDELLAASARAAREHGWAVHTHLAEVREEVVLSRLRWGRTSVERAADVGLFEVPVVAAHGIWVSGPEIALLAGAGVAVVHNPVPT